jgi:hypothetical protein
MKKRGRREILGNPPKSFHPNSTCSEYFLGEVDFLQQNSFTPGRERKISKENDRFIDFLADPAIPATYKISPSAYYLDSIRRYQKWTDTGSRYFDDDVWKYVVEAVRDFGVDALRLNTNDHFRIHPLSDEEIATSAAEFHKMAEQLFPDNAQKKTTGTAVIQLKRLTREDLSAYDSEYAEDSSAWISELEEEPKRQNRVDYLHPLARAQVEAELRELRYRESLGAMICHVLRFWREQVQRGSLKERQRALKHLKAFGKALLPEMRGKRERLRTARPYEVRTFYLKELYRLYHVVHFIKSSDGPRNHSLKIKEASERYELSIELIREFRGLNGADNPDRGPFTPKDMARELTARKLNITHQTVSNLLSS